MPSASMCDYQKSGHVHLLGCQQRQLAIAGIALCIFVQVLAVAASPQTAPTPVKDQGHAAARCANQNRIYIWDLDLVASGIHW